MLEQIRKEVEPAETLSQKLQEKAAPVLAVKLNEPVEMSIEDLTALHVEVAKLGEEAKAALGEVKLKVVNKMRTVNVGAGESKKALGELNVKLATMEARVRQTVSGVKTAMDAKKVEGETKELTEKIVALETSVEEAVNSAPEKLKEEPTDETLADIEKTVKISQEKIQLEIKACGEMIKETSLKDAENKTKLQMLAALKGRLEACNGKMAKLFASSKVQIQMQTFEKMVTELEEGVAMANSEVQQALNDKKTMTADFQTMEKEKQLEVAQNVYETIRHAKDNCKEKGPKLTELLRKVNSAGPTYKQQYLDRVRKLQAEFMRVEKNLGSEADESAVMLEKLRSGEQVAALQKRADEQKKIILDYVEEIKPMIDGQLSEEETQAAQEKTKAKLEELLEGPAKVLSDDITAKLDELPKHAAMVREGYVKIDAAVKGFLFQLKRQAELVDSAPGRARSKEFCREASGMVTAIEEKITSEVEPKRKELSEKAADQEVPTSTLEDLTESFTKMVSELKAEVEKERAAMSAKSKTDTAKEIPEFAREIVRSTTKLQQLGVKLGSMITNTKALVDRRKVNDKINEVKKELRVVLETAAEILKEASPLETLEGLEKAAVKKLST